MSCEWWYHCKTDNCHSETSINHGEEILRSVFRAAPHINAAFEADTYGCLGISIAGDYGHEPFHFLKEHAGHEIELMNENGETEPLCLESNEGAHEEHQKVCPLAVEAEPAGTEGCQPMFRVNLATGEAELRVTMQDGATRVLKVQDWKMNATPKWPMETKPMEAQWKCQQCGGSFRTLIDPAFLVWLIGAPLEQKRVCAACHKQLTREQKIIREAK